MLAANAARIIGNSLAGWPTPLKSNCCNAGVKPTCCSTAPASPSPCTATSRAPSASIPFDTIPRSIPAAEWAHIEAGCIQRVQALNLFLADLYHEQRILKAGVIPAEQVLANDQYQLAMQGLDLPGNVYAHIAGVDLVRDAAATTTCWRTTCARPAVFPTCWKIAR